MRHSFSLPLVMVLSAVLLGASGCGGSSATSPSSGSASQPVQSGAVTVDIKNFSFHPPSLTVKVGTQVTWTNQDPQPTNHTATADHGAFDTGLIAPGASVTRTLLTAGTYTYHCSVHQYMTATITVVG
ncbi:MAG: plastocyanin/azurin family copper-binding protein [Candidatus Dormibacteria bacterium]